MSGELIDVVGRNDLIEVDLMPTNEGEYTPILGTWPSLLTD